MPKFFCDQCDFYSLRSVDLIQHYKTTHHRAEENGRPSQNAAPEESGVYSCDMCLFETRSCSQLRVHYTEQHDVQPTEVQLRPAGRTVVAMKPTTRSSHRQPGSKITPTYRWPLNVSHENVVAKGDSNWTSPVFRSVEK